MPESVQLRDVLVILLAAVVVVSIFHRLRASAVLGYLVAGALIGPHSLGLVRDVGATAILGQFGVVFLLFAIGLELSIERLVALRRYVLGLGAAQVVVTTLIFSAVLRALGLDGGAALIVGSGLALSSTADGGGAGDCRGESPARRRAAAAAWRVAGSGQSAARAVPPGDLCQAGGDPAG